MGLDFGLFPSQDKTLQTADYRTAGSHQAENINHIEINNQAATWIEIHTVTTGKTYYVSGIILSTDSSTIGLSLIGIGGAGSEVTIFKRTIRDTVPMDLGMETPLKFASGTRISGRVNNAAVAQFVLIGWEE